jgi:hypothetical protein
LEGPVGKEWDTVESALEKIRWWEVWCISGSIVLGVGMEKLINASSGIFQLVAAKAKFSRDACYKFDDEIFHEGVVLEERAFIKFVDVLTAENAGVDVLRSRCSDLIDDEVCIGFIVDGVVKVGINGGRSEEGVDTTTIGEIPSGVSFPGFEMSIGGSVGRSHGGALGRTIGIGQIIVDSDGKSAWLEEAFLGRILAVKAGNLENVARVSTVVEKTINHRGGCHVVSGVHKNGTKTDVIEEFCIEIEDGVVGSLYRPVHGKHDGLCHKSRVTVG